TMIVWNADRFGLAQLHQLRGRVGRGSRRGSVYLFTDPDRRPSAAAGKRLQALAEAGGLAAGFAIGARDLEARGAGDLFGPEQSGRIRLIGIALYRHLLERAAATDNAAPTEGGATVE